MLTSRVHHTTRQGWKLSFEAHPMATRWSSKGGVYMFCKREANGLHVPLYVGETENFSQRFSTHERWPEAARHGATHVLASVLATEHERKQVEAALIQELKPPLNKQGLGLRPPTLRW